MESAHTVTIQPAPAYDLLRSVWLVAQPGAIPRWREWAQSTARAMAPGDLRLARRWFKGASAVGLVFDALVPLLPTPADGEQLLVALAQMAIPDFLRAVITGEAIDPDAPLEAADLLALTHDAGLAREYLGRYLRVTGHARSHLLRVLAAPEAARAELVGLLRRHHDQSYTRLEPQLRAERDAAGARWRETNLGHERIRTLFARYGALDDFSPVIVAPSVLLDTQVSVYYQEIRRSLLDGAEYEPFILLVGAQRDLAPSLPTSSPLHTERRPRAKAASASDTVGDAQAAADQAANVFSALAEGSRLRIIHLLAQRPHYGQELAAALGVSAATVTHHVNLLLRAGVVTIERQSHRTYFVLRRDPLLDQLNAGLRYALGEQSAPQTPPLLWERGPGGEVHQALASSGPGGEVHQTPPSPPGKEARGLSSSNPIHKETKETHQ